MSNYIEVEQARGVVTLTFNRPDKRNALTNEMYRVLADRIAAAQLDEKVRAVAIRAAGDMFTAGNDLAEFAAVSALNGPLHVRRFIEAIGTARKPLIAAVQGRAVGIGMTMLLHCDYVILSEDAELSAPFASLGLVPEAASSTLLPQRIGHLRAFDIFGLGRSLSAHAAYTMGLANEIVPRAQLDQSLATAAAHIAAQPPGALEATKGLMRDPAPLLRQMAAESEIFTARLKSPEAIEALTAFAQKRAPNFSPGDLPPK